MMMSRTQCAMAACLAIACSAGSAEAATVWNVNFTGGGGTVIAADEQYKGAASETPADGSGDVTWNNVSGGLTLTDSKILENSIGDNSAGVTLKITDINSTGITVSNSNFGSADKIFGGWAKANNNAQPFNVALSGLSTSFTYDLVIYNEWNWNHSTSDQPVTLTEGSGLAGTYFITSTTHATGAPPAGLTEDSNPADGTTSATGSNYARISGLSSNASGVLAFNISGANTPFSGFQLVEVVPEPSSLALLGLGGLCVLRRRRG